jgi:pyridoxamine 5'-phosphate oxidase
MRFFMNLDIEQLHQNPYHQFATWFAQWKTTEPPEPYTMVLATVDDHHKPWMRTVLLRGQDDRGFVFYTNYQSNKAHQLHANPEAALHFLWQPLGRQVLIQGHVEKTSAQESHDYFQSRPRESQIGAWASEQSTRLSSRSELMQRFEKISQQYENTLIPTPPHWGGYRVIPARYEFWQLGAHRLHDRFVYTKENTHWKIERLNP